MSVITRHRPMSPSEVRVLMRPDVLEREQANPPDRFTGMFTDEQILGILKPGGAMQNQDEKSVIDDGNKQPAWFEISAQSNARRRN